MNLERLPTDAIEETNDRIIVGTSRDHSIYISHRSPSLSSLKKKNASRRAYKLLVPSFAASEPFHLLE